LETFEKILEKEKDKINVKDKYHTTALHRAIESKSVFIIKKLLDSLDSITGDDDLTPLHLAAQWKLKYSPLPESQRNPNQSYVMLSDYKLDESISDITPSLFKKILDKSSGTINAQSSRGLTALHLALYSHSITATRALLQHPKLDVNIKDIENLMAIHLAAKWKDIDVEAFEIILRKTDEDNSKQPHLRESALDYAQESGSQDHHQRTSISYKRRWTNNNNSVKIHHILSNIAELDTTSPVISDIIK
jgi:ankyrin repeat protein